MKDVFPAFTAVIVGLSLGFLSYLLLRYSLFKNGYLGIEAQIQEEVLVLQEELPTQEATSLFEDYTDPIYTPPVRIFLDAYNIDVPIVPLGVDSAGQLEVPKTPQEGGWYFKSAKVGEEGNILISAHYDDAYGKPAAFYNLKSVKVNDTVVVVDSYDRQFPYRVTEIYYISIYDEDRIGKLLESEGASLTLVTCGGFWLTGASNYSQRLIVKAVRDY